MSKEERKLWKIISIYVSLIYITLPFVPYIVDVIRKITKKYFSLAFSIAIILALTYIFLKVRHYLDTPKRKFWAIFLMFSGIITTIIVEIPAEKIHFLLYGMLGFLISKAMSIRFRDLKKYIFSIILGSFLGFVDESIQKFWQVQNFLPLPKRYFEWKDVGQNAFGIYLGVIFFKFIYEPKNTNLILIPHIIGKEIKKEIDKKKKKDKEEKKEGKEMEKLKNEIDEKRGNKKYNVIFLTIDSLRADRISGLGYKRKTTPNIDKLMKSAIVAERGYANSGWTSPSLNSIFSSLYPPTHGVEERGVVIQKNIKTPLDKLLDLGWKVFGEHAEGDTISNLGFSQVTTHIFSFIEEMKEETFFVWYHYRIPHLPYDPEEEFIKSFGENITGTEKIKPILTKKIIEKEDLEELSKSDIEFVNLLYDAEVLKQDKVIGEIIKKLEDIGILSKTIIVITADHGEEIFEHGMIGHASTNKNSSLYEEILRIPIIIFIPFLGKEVRIKRIFEQVDIMPTLFDILGIEKDFESDGVSIFYKRDDIAFASSSPCGWQCPPERKKERIYALVKENMKLIYHEKDNKFELMKIEEGEKENLAEKNIKDLQKMFFTLQERIVKSKIKAFLLKTPQPYKKNL